MQFHRLINDAKSRFHRGISLLGLTKAEASFILFLTATACIGAGIPALKDYYSPVKPDAHLTDSSAAALFRRIAAADTTDSVMIDSLMALIHTDSNVKPLWTERSDSLRRMFIAGKLNTSIDSFLADTGDEPVRKININTANARALTSLPGIGPKMAERIIEYRNQKGAFRSAEDIMKVKGVGKKTFAKLKPYIDI